MSNNTKPKYTIDISSGNFIYLDLDDENAAREASKHLTTQENNWCLRQSVNHEDKDPITSILSVMKSLRSLIVSDKRRRTSLLERSEGTKQLIARWESTKGTPAHIDRLNFANDQHIAEGLLTKIEENQASFNRCLSYLLIMPEITTTKTKPDEHR